MGVPITCVTVFFFVECQLPSSVKVMSSESDLSKIRMKRSSTTRSANEADLSQTGHCQVGFLQGQGRETLNGRKMTFSLQPWFRLNQGSPNFLSEGHISYYATVRGPDFLRDWFFRDTLRSTKSINFPEILFFCYSQNVSAGRIWPAGRSLEIPGLEDCFQPGGATPRGVVNHFRCGDDFRYFLCTATI